MSSLQPIHVKGRDRPGSPSSDSGSSIPDDESPVLGDFNNNVELQLNFSFSMNCFGSVHKNLRARELKFLLKGFCEKTIEDTHSCNLTKDQKMCLVKAVNDFPPKRDDTWRKILLHYPILEQYSEQELDQTFDDLFKRGEICEIGCYFMLSKNDHAQGQVRV